VLGFRIDMFLGKQICAVQLHSSQLPDVKKLQHLQCVTAAAAAEKA
jgi:hypothetical protein